MEGGKGEVRPRQRANRVLTVCVKAPCERPARPGNARRGRLWARLLLHFQALASLLDEDRKREKAAVD